VYLQYSQNLIDKTGNSSHILEAFNHKNNMNDEYIIILFYKYANLEDPEVLAAQQRVWCKELGLKGRTIIAKEGINSTLEGTKSDIEEYIQRMNSHKEFQDIHWKKSVGTGSSFPKLSIKVRDEIVSTHLDVKHKIGPHNGVTGKYITAEELHDWIHSNKKFYIVDMRNDYEFKVGHFKDSILLSKLENFRDLPRAVEDIRDLQNSPIVTVCTGGIRCEKASGFLVHSQFKEVYQLEGGIVTYMEKFPNEDFLGKLYVFDQRIVMGFQTDSPNHQTVGKCDICSASCEEVIDYYLTGSHERKYGIVCLNCLSKGLAITDMQYHQQKQLI
jgi:UPF0176 protein